MSHQRKRPGYGWLLIAVLWLAAGGVSADVPQRTLVIEDEGAIEAQPAEPATEPIDDPEHPGEVSAWRLAPSKLRAETGILDGVSTVRGSHYLHGTGGVRWSAGPSWEAQLAGRVDGYLQTGDPRLDRLELDYAESYLRYRSDRLRVTLGPQVILWGRIDELAPTDRLSVADLNRFILDDLEDRRRAVTALRIEHFLGDYKTDWVWIPRFRPAELPDADSIWYPINSEKGWLLGIPSDPLLAELVGAASFDEDPDDEDHQFGVRLSRAGRDLDAAVTVQYARQSTPYFELAAPVRTGILAGLAPQQAVRRGPGPAFEARYPKSWLIGGDLGFAAAGATWRFEAAYLSDLPATTTDLRYVTRKGLDWGVGTELFPGDGETRVTMQILGHHLLDAGRVIDWERIYTFTGEVETRFDRGRWEANVRFWAGLNRQDWYVNPRLSFLGWAPHELYLAVHFFDGEDGTPGGFYQDNGIVLLGWRAQFR